VISSSLLDRNIVIGVDIPLANLYRTPLNGGEIKNPWPERNARNIVRFMFLLHERRGWKPPRRFKSYIWEARQMLAKHDGDTLEKALRKAAHVAKHPFGFTFVEHIIGEENGNKTYTKS